MEPRLDQGRGDCNLHRAGTEVATDTFMQQEVQNQRSSFTTTLNPPTYKDSSKSGISPASLSEEPEVARKIRVLEKSPHPVDRELARALLIHALQFDPQNPFFIEVIPRVFSLEQRQTFRLQSLLERSTHIEHRLQHAHSLFEAKKFLLAKEKYFEILTELIEIHPKHGEIYKNLGNIFCHEGDFEAAEEYYLKALTLEPKSDVLRSNLGFLEIQRRNYAEAENFFQLALEQNQKSDRAWTGLGLIHLARENWDMAHAAFLQALERNSSNRVALQSLGQASLSLGQFHGVTEHFSNYLRSNPFDHEIRQAFIFLLETQEDESSAQLERMHLEILREDMS